MSVPDWQSVVPLGVRAFHAMNGHYDMNRRLISDGNLNECETEMARIVQT